MVGFIIQKSLKKGKKTQAKFFVTPGITRINKGWKKSDFIKTGKKKKQIRFSDFDLDNDGVNNRLDCNPYDPNKTDFGGLGGKKVRTLQGYNVDDYYYSNGEYRLMRGAKKVERKGFLGRIVD